MTDGLETAVSETKAVTQSEEFEKSVPLWNQFRVHTCTGFTGRVSKYMLFGTDDKKTKLSTVGNPADGQDQPEAV